jgi:arylsulfatase A
VKYLLLVLFVALPVELWAADRPNILIILADDQGYGDVSANNPESKIETPHIDRLAKEGIRFTDAHTSSGVCTPTRYSLLTGRYHWRTRLQSGVLGGFSRPLIDRDRLTLAGMLSQQGYHTACFGKWHLGMNWPLQGGRTADDAGNFEKPFDDIGLVDYQAPITDGPVDRGFHTFYGISASLDMFPYVWIHDRQPTEMATATKAFFRPGPAGPKFEAIDVQSEIINRTIGYIADRSSSARQGQPFFAYVPLAAPHTPILPTPTWQGSSQINAYADFVKQVDSDIGRLLDALEQHGIADNTLIFFTSDNGCSPAAKIPELQAAGHEPSYIYRGHKADAYEGGHRVPFLARWPARIQGNRVSHQLIGQLDFMATFAEMLEISLPATVGEDSVSFLPVLLNAEPPPLRKSIISQSIDGCFAVRDGHWKLILCPGSGGWSPPRPGRDDHRGLPEFQLFDLQSDPRESQNLVTQFPERVAAMKRSLEEAIAHGRTNRGPDLKNDVAIELIKPIPELRLPKAKGSAPK